MKKVFIITSLILFSYSIPSIAEIKINNGGDNYVKMKDSYGDEQYLYCDGKKVTHKEYKKFHSFDDECKLSNENKKPIKRQTKEPMLWE